MEIATKEISSVAPIIEARPTLVPASPIQSTVESSVTEYSKPATITPSPTVTQIVSETILNRPIAPSINTPVAETRPLLVNNLMIDPSIGTATVLTPSGGGFGGGGGGGASSKSEEGTGIKKKSWLPVILIGIGVLIIASKFFKKKTA